MFKFLRKTYLYVLALPILFMALGVASNQVVLYANHDRFPVSVNLVKAHNMAPDAVELPDGVVMLDDIHCLMTEKTHLNLLADIFDFHQDIESVGDMSIELGGWMWTFTPFVWGVLVVRKLKD